MRLLAIGFTSIGFTSKRAQRFFGLLRAAGVKRVADVRLNNISPLAGFAKRDDLAWLLREIGDMEYLHAPAPARQGHARCLPQGRHRLARRPTIVAMAGRVDSFLIHRNRVDCSTMPRVELAENPAFSSAVGVGGSSGTTTGARAGRWR